MVGRTQQLTEWAKAQSVKHVPISLFCEQHDALICMPVRAHGARQRARSQYVCVQQVLGAKRPGALQRARSSSESVETVVGTVHLARVSAPAPVQISGREYDNPEHSCNTSRRASARPLPRHNRLQNHRINAFQLVCHACVHTRQWHIAARILTSPQPPTLARAATSSITSLLHTFTTDCQ